MSCDPRLTRRQLLAGAAASGLVMVVSKSAPRAAGVKPGGTLIFAVGSDISGLDPQLHRGFLNTEIEQQMYDPLYRFSPGSTSYEPALAQTMTRSADGLEYTFVLRPGLRFHDGTPLDAEAYKFVMERQAFEDNPYHKGGGFGPYANWFNGHPGFLDSVAAVDKRTLRFKLKKPVPSFMYFAADLTAAAFSPEVCKKDPPNWGKKPVGAGSGPFLFEAWVPNQQVTFKRFDGYWEKGRPYVDRLIVRPMPDPAARVLAVKRGEVHIIPVLGPEVPELSKDPNVMLVKGPFSPNTFIGFNYMDPVLKDRRVRLAVCQAINRELLVKNLWPGTAIVANNMGLYPGMVGYREDIKWYPYDPAKSRQLLTEAGHPNGFEVTLTFSNDRGNAPDMQALAQAIQSELGKVGIRVKLQQVDASTLVSNSYADPKTGTFAYQMMLNGNGSRGDPQELLSVWGNWTDYGIRTPEYKKLLDQAATEVDDKKRIQLWGEAQQRLYDDVAFLPIAHSQTILAAYKTVHGLKAPYTEWPVYLKDCWLA